MKLKSILIQLALLAAFAGSAANAQQLPGNISLGGVPNGFFTISPDGIPVRDYYNSFLPSNPYNVTAALISNAAPGLVPDCAYSASNHVWTIANVYFSHEFTQRQKINGVWRDNVSVWKRCTNSTSTWSPTGQQLVFTEYAGTFRPVVNSTKGAWQFNSNLILPLYNRNFQQLSTAPIATEWKVFN